MAHVQTFFLIFCEQFVINFYTVKPANAFCDHAVTAGAGFVGKGYLSPKYVMLRAVDI